MPGSRGSPRTHSCILMPASALASTARPLAASPATGRSATSKPGARSSPPPRAITSATTTAASAAAAGTSTRGRSSRAAAARRPARPLAGDRVEHALLERGAGGPASAIGAASASSRGSPARPRVLGRALRAGREVLAHGASSAGSSAPRT